MKKMGVALLAVILLLTITACGNEKASSSGEKEITILYVGDQFWQDQAAEFEEETGIKVNYEVVGFEQLHDKMFTALSGGSDDYDIIHVRDDWADEFASQGFLEPLDDYITDDVKNSFSQLSFDNLSYDGNIYGVPRYLWLTQFYYNKEIFEEAGITKVPETWDELIEVGKQIQEKTDIEYALSTQLREQDAIRPFILNLRAEGGEFWDYSTNKPTFNTPEGLKSLQRLEEINMDAKILDPLSFENEASKDQFLQGKTAMFIGYPDIVGFANDPEKSKIIGKLGTALMPGSTEKTSSLAETGAIGIPANSKHKEEAFEFIKFATSAEQEKKMALSEVARIPANLDVLEDSEVLEKYPHFAYVSEQIQYPHGLFKHKQATLISDTVSRQFIQVIKGEKNAEKALSDAEAEVLNINP
ncbi:sugar ABC transporter substrate-binding protein [Niallia sp. RD1]|uniref:ABC transporter substrate-binding protein n=1 Tax=Niallia sp. RD1 TaxID=2962858 RepID=UPI0020C199FD|nr:sugar ABC transporter substrate-binding protein [Niallia sp. RD1]UTI40207.1 sugar ABC transporter substrate-binding protein [Niallia sp. RD1]